MWKLILCIGVVCATVASPVYAGTGQVSANVNIIYVENSTTLYSTVDLSNSSGGTGACYQPPAASRLFVLPPTAVGDKLRQILLSAMLSGKKVNVYWDDTKTWTSNGHAYCIVQKVAIKN